MLFPKPVSRDKDSPVRNCRMCRKLFNRWRGSSTLCPGCWKLKREARQEARVDRRKRDGEYPKPDGVWWDSQKAKAQDVEAKCEVCGMGEAECKRRYGCGLTRDHIMPARFARQLGADPHLDLNIMLLCSADCGRKTAAEVKLFGGDVLGFVTDLQKFGWNMEELEMVLKHYRYFPVVLEHFFR